MPRTERTYPSPLWRQELQVFDSQSLIELHNLHGTKWRAQRICSCRGQFVLRSQLQHSAWRITTWKRSSDFAESTKRESLATATTQSRPSIRERDDVSPQGIASVGLSSMVATDVALAVTMSTKSAAVPAAHGVIAPLLHLPAGRPPQLAE